MTAEDSYVSVRAESFMVTASLPLLRRCWYDPHVTDQAGGGQLYWLQDLGLRQSSWQLVLVSLELKTPRQWGSTPGSQCEILHCTLTFWSPISEKYMLFSQLLTVPTSWHMPCWCVCWCEQPTTPPAVYKSGTLVSSIYCCGDSDRWCCCQPKCLQDGISPDGSVSLLCHQAHTSLIHWVPGFYHILCSLL